MSLQAFDPRAERNADRAERIKQLEQEGEFRRILQKTVAKRETPPPLTDLEKMIMRHDLERSIGKVAKPAAKVATRSAVGDVLGGPLGVILPTVLFPDEERRARDAAAEAAIQKAQIPRPRRPQARTRPILPPPLPPAAVPSRPGLTPDALGQLLGERPRRRGRKTTRRARKTTSPKAPKLPPWADVVAQVLGDTLDHYRRKYKLLPKKRRGRRGAAAFPSFGFDASADVSPPVPGRQAQTVPRDLTRVKTDVLPSPPASDRDRCRCERPAPRPSDKVPTVRSYKRRMSQNSLDNLRRG